MSARPIVTFRWEGEDWAFDADEVVELVGARTVTPLPGVSSRVLGIVTWRGRTLPVIAPRPLKDRPRSSDLKTRLLVLGRAGPFAVPVDEPGHVIEASAAEPVAWTGSEIEAGAGVRLLRVDGRLVRVLEPRGLVGALSDVQEGQATVPRERR